MDYDRKNAQRIIDILREKTQAYSSLKESRKI
jgi:hypothetical protein